MQRNQGSRGSASWVRLLVSLMLAGCLACSGSDGGKGNGGDGDGDGDADAGPGDGDGDGDEELPAEVVAFLNGLPAWESPANSSETASEPVQQLRDLTTPAGPRTYSCQVVQHDVTQKHDEILNFDSGSEYLRPGVLLVGNDYKQGVLSPIPLARTPIKLSINVPGIDEATVTVDDPNTANIQQGVAELQAGAQAAAGGSYAAQLSFEQHSVQSVDEMAFKIGVAASYDGLFASASFSSKFEHQESQRKFTVVSKLMQQMYTITFAQDALPKASDFFDPALTQSEFDAARTDGFLGTDNIPVFIGSVTYGRMVVFSATSTQVESSSQLEAQLSAAGAAWSANVELSGEQKSFLSTLDIQVLSIGGDQAKVTQAITSGNWNDLYADADILSSVPLRYTVHALSGTRPVAAIGDTTMFSTADCAAVQGWYQIPSPEGVAFTDVSTNPTNDPIFAIGQKQGVYAPYEIVNEELVPVQGFSGALLRDITVDEAGAAYVVDGENLYQLPRGGSVWGSKPSVMHWIDAGAPNRLVALSLTYSDNQNDIYIQTWPNDQQYRIDEGQAIKKDDTATLTAVGTGYYYVWWWSNDLGHINADNVWTSLQFDGNDIATIQYLSAASDAELYVLRNDGKIYLVDRANKTFVSPIDPPAGKALERIEASSNGRLWAITTDGLLYSYVKPF